MSEVKLQFSGKHAIIGLAIFVLILGARIATLGESDDPALHEKVRAELVNTLGGRTGQELERLDRSDAAAVQAAVERANPEGTQVHSISVSKPLLKFGTSADAVVRVRYSLPDGPVQTAYWRMNHSTVAGWRYQRRGHVVAYYLNFL